MELGGEGDLEQHVLHHVTAEPAMELELPALEQNVVEAPGLGSEHGGVTHFARFGDEREPHRTGSGVARRTALARTGVRRVAVGAQPVTIDPSLRRRVHYLVVAAADHLSAANHARGLYPHRSVPSPPLI